jgi:predicted DNA-binding transcriptional regulator AlpA
MSKNSSKRDSQKKHLTTKQLAERWGLHPMTLYLWRKDNKGPKYIKLGLSKRSPVLYPIKNVEAYEKLYMEGGE